MPGGVRDLVRERAHRAGPIPFDEFLDLALYAPDAGFYESGGAAGPDTRGGHFLTSPTLGPLFGAVVARALDAWWAELGEPDPFVVAEAAAGAGDLARAVLDASPRCLPALRYLLVERSELLRARHPTRLPIDPAAHVLGPMAPADEEDDEGARALPGRGPRFASLPDLPAGPLTGVVIANELLDNLPFALLERRAPSPDPSAWSEVRVTADLEEVLVPASPALAAEADRFAPDVAVGARVPLQRAAADWMRDALRVVDRGRVVIVDYASTTQALGERPWRDWLRTYRAGGPGGGPLEHVGEQDVTCEVCVDQLAAWAAPPTIDRSQAEFLCAHGIDALVEEARSAWHASTGTAAAGGLESIRARSRVSEASALTDPTGLGAFRVLEWVVA